MRSAVVESAAHPLEASLPTIAPLPPLVSVVEPLSEAQYETLYRHVLRAVLQRPWQELSPEDASVVVERVKRCFLKRSARLTQRELDAVELDISKEPVAKALTSYCVAYMNSHPENYDQHRIAENYLAPEYKREFDESMTQLVSKRLSMANRTMGHDAKQRQLVTQIYESIRSGDALRAQPYGAKGQTDEVTSEFAAGCFGNSLTITVRNLVWRKQQADEAHANFGFAKLGKKLSAAVQILVDGQPQGAQTVVRCVARQVFEDPTVLHHTGENQEVTVEAGSIGSARFWNFPEQAPVTLSVGGGFVTAERTAVAISIRKERRFGCFDFDEIARVEIPLDSLYYDILSLSDPLRAEFNAGYHFTCRHYVDSVTGVGATVALHLQCLDRTHCDEPLFDPETQPKAVPDTAPDASRLLTSWADVFRFPHHSAMLHLFEVFGEVSDVEYEILDAYRDLYLIDEEFFNTAACIARAKYNGVADDGDLRDALKGVKYVVDRSFMARTFATRSLAGESLAEIRNRFLGVLCELEHFTTPKTAHACVTVARDILTTTGLKDPSAISDSIRRTVKTDLLDQTRRIEKAFGNASQLAQRANAVFTLFNAELAILGRGIKFSKAAQDAPATRGLPDHAEKKARILVPAVIAHRISCQLEVLVPFLDRFMDDAVGLLVRNQTQYDPIGETFCILCGMQRLVVDCYEATEAMTALKPQAARLVAIFKPFLGHWLGLVQPRMLFCMNQAMKEASLKPVSSRTVVSSAPADGIQLINEAIEFFWQCASCSDGTTLGPCLIPFADFVARLAQEFVKAYTERLANVDFEYRPNVMQVVSVPECFQTQFSGIASLGVFARLFDEAVDDATTPIDELKGAVEGHFTRVFRDKLHVASTTLHREVKQFAWSHVASNVVPRFCRNQAMFIVKNGAIAVEDVTRRLAGLLEMLQTACKDASVERAAESIIPGIYYSIANVCSKLDKAAAKKEAHVHFAQLVLDLDAAFTCTNETMLDAISIHRTLCTNAINLWRQQTDLLVAQLERGGSDIVSKWASNVLVARAEAGDSTAKQAVNRMGLCTSVVEPRAPTS